MGFSGCYILFNLKNKAMKIVNEKTTQINGKLTRIKTPHKYFLFGVISFICRIIFELIHYKHYIEDNIKTIQINGIRKALVENKYGQRKRVVFYWKIDRYFL